MMAVGSASRAMCGADRPAAADSQGHGEPAPDSRGTVEYRLSIEHGAVPDDNANWSRVWLPEARWGRRIGRSRLGQRIEHPAGDAATDENPDAH